MFVQDGQHRRAAIEQLLTDAPLLHDNTIAVMLFPDPMLDRSPAIFSALNQQYVQRNASRRVAHDPVRPLASVARRITEEALIFQGRVDYERTTIFNRALAMFTMNAVFPGDSGAAGGRRAGGDFR
jgi:DNA sulfur modification protein DndB